MLLLISSLVVYSQDEAPLSYKNTFSFSPLKFTENAFQIGYERYLSDDKSIYLGLGAIYKDEYEKEEGFLGELHFRYDVYRSVRKSSVFSVFFSPYIQYKYVDINRISYVYDGPQVTTEDVGTTIHAYGGGVLIGIKLAVVKRLMFDLYLGGGMRRTNDFNKNSDYRYYENSIWDHGYNGIAPKVGFNVGFRF